MFLIQAVLVAMANKLDNINNEPTKEEISRDVKVKEEKIEEKTKEIREIRADIKEKEKKIEEKEKKIENEQDEQNRNLLEAVLKSSIHSLKILESSLQSLERSIAKLEDEKEQLLSQRQSMMEKLTLQLNQMSLGKLVCLFPCCDDPICSHFLAAAVQPFGKHHVDMSVNGILQFLHSLQSQRKLRRRDMLHNEEELNLELHGRKEAEDVMVTMFRQRRENFMKEPQPEDRMLYPMPVCSGMSGLGKTRMLEEWPRLFELAGIPQPWLGVFSTYANGHAPHEFEQTMPIQPAFGWRMLHRLFVEGNTAGQHGRWNSLFLPCNATALTLPLALSVVRAEAQQLGLVDEDGTLSFFLAIDEYQRIPVGSTYKPEEAEKQRDERMKSFLWRLIGALLDCLSVKGLHLYVGFAGTRWDPISIAGSSAPYIERVPLNLLSSAMMEDVVRSNENAKKRLASPDFRRNLFFLGGVPRPSVLYALDRLPFKRVWEVFVRKGWTGSSGFTPNNLLYLIAVALSGNTVNYNGISCINNLKWKRLFDEGVGMLLPDDQLGIPYFVFRLAAGFRETYDCSWTPELKCLVQNLKYLTEHVDNVLFDNLPWYSWEKFGACFFAMRVNALLVMKDKAVPFHRLLQGSVVRGCMEKVKLVPMEVHAIKEKLGTDLGVTVTERKDHRNLDWVNGDSGIRYCLVNGEGGQGVDFFATLPLADQSGGLVIYNDQRKVVASSLGPVTTTALLNKAHIVPKCLPAGSLCVRGLFQ